MTAQLLNITGKVDKVLNCQEKRFKSTLFSGVDGYPMKSIQDFEDMETDDNNEARENLVSITLSQCLIKILAH